MLDIDLRNKNKISINILGACFLRDAFGLGKIFGDYIVKEFIQNNSIFSMNSEPFSSLTKEQILPDDMKKTHLCWHKWLDFDAKKSVFDFLSKNISDYLIFGLTEVTYNLLKIENEEGKSCYLTTSHGISVNNPFSLPKFSSLVISTLSPLTFMRENPEFIEESLCRLEKRMIDLYKNTKKIIFVNIYPARYYIHENSVLKSFGVKEQDIEFLQFCANHFIKNVNPSVVNVPLNILGDENHQWGKGIWHYTDEVYEFLLASFALIMREEKDLEIKLQKLYFKCEESYVKKMIDICKG
ncbi:MAG TPA: hypothetical protein DDY68_01965 [Porphyromonadaceae bacterium]|nr:hypothetical protein [Porphyromonadaceae bacterium]